MFVFCKCLTCYACFLRGNQNYVNDRIWKQFFCQVTSPGVLLVHMMMCQAERDLLDCVNNELQNEMKGSTFLQLSFFKNTSNY